MGKSEVVNGEIRVYLIVLRGGPVGMLTSSTSHHPARNHLTAHILEKELFLAVPHKLRPQDQGEGHWLRSCFGLGENSKGSLLFLTVLHMIYS